MAGIVTTWLQESLRAVRGKRKHRDASPPHTAGAVPKKITFQTSAQYWEDRYRTGGHSGVGSRNRLAEFKAEIINEFVARNKVRSVSELGCGDGAQLSLASYPRYAGYDVSETAIRLCRETYAGDATKSFAVLSPTDTPASAELVLSLDVIYHLVENGTFERYMAQVFDTAERFVIIYSSNEDKVAREPHIRHRRFTDWVEANSPAFKLAEHIPNRYPADPDDPKNTSFADFYIYARSTPATTATCTTD